MTNPRVYIPSRSRWANVPKLVKAWDDEMFDVVFSVEPDEAGQYAQAIADTTHHNEVSVITLPDRNLGVGFSRTFCLEHAYKDGLESIICSDDDVKPVSGMDYLIDAAADPRVLGITSWYSYLDLMLGITSKERQQMIADKRSILVATCCIVRIFGLNVENSLDVVGGFDPELKCGDDADFVIRGFQEGFPWLIHLGAKSNSMAARFAPGGVAALEDAVSDGEVIGAKGAATRDAVAKIAAKFPGYARAARPDKLTYKWRKMLDDYLPEWRTWSELHGGSIDKYLGEGHGYA